LIVKFCTNGHAPPWLDFHAVAWRWQAPDKSSESPFSGMAHRPEEADHGSMPA
jgi:hypothetical protein